MSDFDNKLQEQIKGLINTHLNTFEKEVATLQQSIQGLIKESFDKVLKTASQGLTDLTNAQDIAKVIEELTSQLATEKTQLENKNTELITENKKLSEEKATLTTENEKLTKKKSSLLKEKNELTEKNTLLETEKTNLETEKATLLAEKEKLAAEKVVVSENKSNTNIAILKVAINEIQANKTQSDVLSALVSQASSFSPRIALFIVKSGNAIGWMSRGFSENEQGSTSIKTISIPLQADTVLRTVLGKQVVFVGNPSVQAENHILFSKFNSPAPTQVLGIPLLVRNKAAAVLYADSSNLLGDVINVEALEILVNMAGLAIELISIRPRGPEGQPASVPGMTQALTQPPTALSEQPKPVSPVAPVMPPTPTRVSSPSPVTPPPPIKETIVNEAKEPAGLVPPLVPSLEKEEAPKIDIPAPSPTPKIHTPAELKKPEMPIAELPQVVVPPAPVAPVVPTNDVLRTSSAGIKDAALKASSPGVKPDLPKIPTPPSWQSPALDLPKPPEPMFPPPNIPVPASHPTGSSGPLTQRRGSTGPLSPPKQDSGSLSKQQAKPVPANEEEQKLHNDAKRFARLLVSEIKLYNEQKVLDGRKNSDLYDRLKEDIDRSRQMYDKRVSALVAAKYDYFYDELVNTLAEGDASKLGRDCPGPSVQVF